MKITEIGENVYFVARTTDVEGALTFDLWPKIIIFKFRTYLYELKYAVK